MDNTPKITRTPPRDLEAEKAVLGAAFLAKDAIVQAREYLTDEDFYSRRHQIIFKAMTKLNDNDRPIDIISMKNELDQEKEMSNVGGMEYLTELAESVPTAADVSYYAKLVRDKSTARRLIDTATQIAGKGYEDNEDLTSLLDEAERSILNVAESNKNGELQNISPLLVESADHIYALSKQKSDVTGLTTGYPQLDEMTKGLHPDELIIIAARPAMGKTAFALNIAQNVAVKNDTTVAIFSLEMGAESLVNRMICAEGSINAGHLRTGKLSEDEWRSFWMATESLDKTSIYIDDTPGIQVPEIRAKCRRLAKKTGNLGLIVIDYLQLIEGGNAENRQQEVSEISRQLKKLAKELEVPVIALSQLSRGVEQRQDKRPVLSDIRESGSIEQDADIVSFLYRDDYYEHDEDSEDNNNPGNNQDDDGSNASEVEVIIEKNRSGPRGTVKLLFAKSYNKFTSISYIPEDNN